jgi:cobalt-zinc-cadmium efflux system outer membrane protein
MKSIIYSMLALIFTGPSFVANAQIDTSFPQKPITHQEFLSTVNKQNLAYAAEQCNLSISEAAIEMARILPDPELSLGASNNGQRRMRMGYGVNTSLGWVLELGGKRKARINLAQNQRALTRALLEDFYRNLRADATIAFLDALMKKEQLTELSNSYQQLKTLAQADSIRFRLGQINEVDARQSQVEAGSLLNDVFQSEAEWKSSLVELGLLMGKQSNDTLPLPSGGFTGFDRDMDIGPLLTNALNTRADLAAARQNKSLTQSQLRLIKANRVMDLGVNAGIANTSVVTNIVAPTPSFTTVSAGIAIPLKFSNKNQGELKAAAYGIQQANLQYQQTELQIQTEVIQAWYRYKAAQKQVHQFNTGLLLDAKRVLEGKTYSYQRGETTLLELLIAQRTYNETQLGYVTCLYNHATALVELERAAGIWDIHF